MPQKKIDITQEELRSAIYKILNNSDSDPSPLNFCQISERVTKEPFNIICKSEELTTALIELIKSDSVKFVPAYDDRGINAYDVRFTISTGPSNYGGAEEDPL